MQRAIRKLSWQATVALSAALVMAGIGVAIPGQALAAAKPSGVASKPAAAWAGEDKCRVTVSPTRRW